MSDSTPVRPVPDGVLDLGEDRVCETIDELGFHLFDLEALPWEAAVREAMQNAHLASAVGVQEKWLVRPDEGKDRMSVSIIRFPPDFAFARHWHEHGEFIVILRGTAVFAGSVLRPGDMAYVDSKVIYGSEQAGPDGVEFLMVRRAHSETGIVPS